MGFLETRFHLVNDPSPTPLSCNVSYTNLTLPGPFDIKRRAGVFCIQELQSLDVIVGAMVISITISVKCTSLRPQGSASIKSQDPDNFL